MGETTEINTNTLTTDQVKSFLENDSNGKQLAQQLADSRIQAGIKSYEEKFMKEKFPSLLNEEISKRYPSETPEQKRLKELELKFEQVQKEKERAEIFGKALKYANEKSIPDFFVEELISNDFDSTKNRLDTFSQKFNDAINEAVEQRLSGTGRTSVPASNNTDEKGLTAKDILKMKPEERAKLDKNLVQSILQKQYETM